MSKVLYHLRIKNLKRYIFFLNSRKNRSPARGPAAILLGKNLLTGIEEA